MTKKATLVLFEALCCEEKAGNTSAMPLWRRISKFLDQLRFTIIGSNSDGEPIRWPYEHCTPPQQVRAARLAEYEIRDSLAVARNSFSRSALKRINNLSAELDTLLAVLPKRLTDHELETNINQLVLQEISLKGDDHPSRTTASVIRLLNEKHCGRYDGRLAQKIATHLVESLTE